ncbi:MAG: hypothetical protein HRT90_10110 [Candidatus Margulisbacteria bacterium]|nr:hypothetical protein [Candidatus Margulisiibacteriota bacterium]
MKKIVAFKHGFSENTLYERHRVVARKIYNEVIMKKLTAMKISCRLSIAPHDVNMLFIDTEQNDAENVATFFDLKHYIPETDPTISDDWGHSSRITIIFNNVLERNGTKEDGVYFNSFINNLLSKVDKDSIIPPSIVKREEFISNMYNIFLTTIANYSHWGRSTPFLSRYEIFFVDIITRCLHVFASNFCNEPDNTDYPSFKLSLGPPSNQNTDSSKGCVLFHQPSPYDYKVEYTYEQTVKFLELMLHRYPEFWVGKYKKEFIYHGKHYINKFLQNINILYHGVSEIRFERDSEDYNKEKLKKSYLKMLPQMQDKFLPDILQACLIRLFPAYLKNLESLKDLKHTKSYKCAMAESAGTYLYAHHSKKNTNTIIDTVTDYTLSIHSEQGKYSYILKSNAAVNTVDIHFTQGKLHYLKEEHFIGEIDFPYINETDETELGKTQKNHMVRIILLLVAMTPESDTYYSVSGLNKTSQTFSDPSSRPHHYWHPKPITEEEYLNHRTTTPRFNNPTLDTPPQPENNNANDIDAKLDVLIMEFKS